MSELSFTDYSRMRMAQRGVPEDAVYHVVGDCDERIDRDDGRTEFIGEWEGLTILVVVEGDPDDEEAPLLVINTIVERRWRR